jgi:hypothetical protein
MSNKGQAAKQNRHFTQLVTTAKIDSFSSSSLDTSISLSRLC